MMSVEGSTITSRIKNLLRSPSIKLRRSKPRSKREDISSKSWKRLLGLWKVIRDACARGLNRSGEREEEEKLCASWLQSVVQAYNPVLKVVRL
ncbi:Mitogen-activated protein kinase-binding protein 1 [Chelonia mydas]|uniref:Mitogen-activated protein kinase-binding protein 1 n=1 Tax=Chelonia mydas TaxID=8469 RepID=M7C545_CHEMY|nr:Mitogen-activated protein kinase-binding protein 1 [Chelonia mydas]